MNFNLVSLVTEKCQNMEMTLDAVGRTETQIRVSAKTSGNEATFVFENVMPGKYKGNFSFPYFSSTVFLACRNG